MEFKEKVKHGEKINLLVTIEILYLLHVHGKFKTSAKWLTC